MEATSKLDHFFIETTLKEKYLLDDNDWQVLLQWLDNLTEDYKNNFTYQKFYQDTNIPYLKAVNLFDLAKEKKKIMGNFSFSCPICGEEVALVDNPQKLVKKTLFCTKNHSIIPAEHPEYIIKSFSLEKKPYYQMDRRKVSEQVS